MGDIREMVEAGQRRTRLAAVVAVHLLLGLTMAGVSPLLSPAVRLPVWVQILFIGLVGSELLLLGVWAGFAELRWKTRLAGVLAGLVWLWSICLLADCAWRHPSGSRVVFETPAILAACAMVVALGAMAVRRWFARLELRRYWEPPRVSQELQFTTQSLIGLTLVMATLLSIGRVARWLEHSHYNFVIVMTVFPLIVALGAVMLVWSALGPGRVGVRVPLMFVAVAALGLFPFFCSGQARPAEIWIWPLLTLVTALYAAASLLAVRACGYRLVRLASPDAGR